MACPKVDAWLESTPPSLSVVYFMKFCRPYQVRSFHIRSRRPWLTLRFWPSRLLCSVPISGGSISWYFDVVMAIGFDSRQPVCSSADVFYHWFCRPPRLAAVPHRGQLRGQFVGHGGAKRFLWRIPPDTESLILATGWHGQVTDWARCYRREWFLHQGFQHMRHVPRLGHQAISFATLEFQGKLLRKSFSEEKSLVTNCHKWHASEN